VMFGSFDAQGMEQAASMELVRLASLGASTPRVTLTIS